MLTEAMPAELEAAFSSRLIELLSTGLASEIRVTLNRLFKKAMCMPQGGWTTIKSTVKTFEEVIFTPYVKQLVAKGYVEEKPSSRGSLFSLLTEKLDEIINKEILLQLKTLAHVDEVQNVMVELFKSALKDAVQEIKSANRRNDLDPSSLVETFVIAARKAFPAGVGYLDNIVYNRYPITELEVALPRVQCELELQSKSDPDGKRSDERVVLRYANVSIHDDLRKEISSPSDLENIKILDSLTIEQTLRLYLQSASHEVEIQIEKERYRIQQEQSLRNAKSQWTFLRELPLWAWVLVFYLFSDNVFSLLSTSLFWVLLLLGFYLSIIPLLPSQNSL
eukprot:CAMPEP_0201531288 /NCGR_PEP_ID=MMETSP0161_2-20130828/47180_1 /ASSEMBLY_ACC=CAM_ASM_000251 /TAXON_ID=180227 /ORGANISM="Neoparamoeba aestuarina, Strain SoJaBio B1-5/56/2" /LENGTH=335 /DNA_ID=CAMNT_0047934105 /DNA_START=12 /DNA_END=1015 /DNA_ORIENTATION=-